MKTPATIMFHSVGLEHYEWAYPHISEPIVLFEKKIAAIKKAGLESVFFKDIPALSSPVGKVVLTFDDGYLDNWVHVFPVLQKYEIKATIFVSPDFVDTRHGRRSLVLHGDFKEHLHKPETCCAGFLSWEEMRVMEQSGLVDIQSHALTHTWYFKGPSIVDFWHPGSATEHMGPVWMLWNKYPEMKPYYLTQAAAYEDGIPYGTPVYEHAKALTVRRYFPDGGIDAALIEYVARNGGKRFFQNDNWRARLRGIANAYHQTGNGTAGRGKYENEDERRARIEKELREGKSIIEKNLDKRVEAICWPGGGVDEYVIALAKEVGYKYFTLPSAWQSVRKKGLYAAMVPRMSSMSGHLTWHGRDLGAPTLAAFIWRIRGQGGSWFYRWLFRCMMLTRLIRSFIKPFARKADP